MKEKENMINKCYECEFRGTIPGNAHSKCTHPYWKDNNVTGDPHGIKSGWFFFPFNFDPTWLLTCDGFKQNGSEGGGE
jgi:hypothetical protein